MERAALQALVWRSHTEPLHSRQGGQISEKIKPLLYQSLKKQAILFITTSAILLQALKPDPSVRLRRTAPLEEEQLADNDWKMVKGIQALTEIH